VVSASAQRNVENVSQFQFFPPCFGLADFGLVFVNLTVEYHGSEGRERARGDLHFGLQGPVVVVFELFLYTWGLARNVR
jgi:hypothetical protein